jgi:hypothetical protein
LSEVLDLQLFTLPHSTFLTWSLGRHTT